jgi:hypothetical protein
MVFNSRGSCEGLLILLGCLLGGGSALDHAHDVGLFHDQELLTADLDFAPRPFAEQNDVARFEIEGNELAALIAGSRSHRNDLALLRLLLDGVGNDDAALGLLLALKPADDDGRATDEIS